MTRHICGEGLSEADRLHGYQQTLRAEIADLRALVARLIAAPAPTELVAACKPRRKRKTQPSTAQGGA